MAAFQDKLSREILLAMLSLENIKLPLMVNWFTNIKIILEKLAQKGSSQMNGLELGQSMLLTKTFLLGFRLIE